MKKPAWIDVDEIDSKVNIVEKSRLRKLKYEGHEKILDGVTYENRLREQFVKIYGEQKWAKRGSNKSSSGEESSEEELEVVFGAVESCQRNRKLKFYKIFDANSDRQPSAPVGSVEFHPNMDMLLTAGHHQILQLFHINGKESCEKLSVKIDDFPIYCSHFCNEGNEIICSSKRPHFYVHDLVNCRGNFIEKIRGQSELSWTSFQCSPDSKTIAFIGDGGSIVLISAKTKQWICNLKAGTNITDVAFTNDNRLYAVGDAGDIFLWDIGQRKCIEKIHTPHIYKSTAISCSKDNSFVACGTESGVVSVFNTNSLSTKEVKPDKEYLNLVTSTTFLKFNPSTELLCFGSHLKKNAVRMVNLRDFSIYRDWPVIHGGQSIGSIYSADFSSNGKYLSLGTGSGKALLYKIQI